MTKCKDKSCGREQRIREKAGLRITEPVFSQHAGSAACLPEIFSKKYPLW